MISWHFNQRYAASAAAPLFASLAATFAARGELIAHDPLSSVERLTAGDKRYYVKRYRGNGKNAWRRWFGLRGLLAPQRVVKEWQNLQRFAAWGIPTAEIVAHGLERRCGSFVRGALVTAEIPATRDLASLALAGDARLRNPVWVAALSRQLAAYARNMHRRGFVHNDFKWRNILVDDAPTPTAYLIDCPQGAFWRGPFLAYRIVKDLACLDKVAKYHLTRSQRLRFYLAYSGRKRLTPADKRRLRRIVHFFAGRE